MGKTAFIYPGQGAQKTGMGFDFYKESPVAKEIFDLAEEALQLDIKHICFEEDERLDLTEYTQAAMVTTCLAMTETVKGLGLLPDMTAGLSLGEYAAIAVAGGFTYMDAIKLVRKRGYLMQSAVPIGEGAMCAVLSLDEKVIEEVTDGIDGVTIANYNCPGQIVITGKKEAVELAAQKLKEAGARKTIMLNVSGPFHSPLLLPAGEQLALELEKTEIAPLKLPYVTNVNAGVVCDNTQVRALLARQVSSPVCWMQSVKTMISEGVDTFVEIGPGRTLTGFIKKIDSSVAVYNIASLADADKVAQTLAV